MSAPDRIDALRLITEAFANNPLIPESEREIFQEVLKVIDQMMRYNQDLDEIREKMIVQMEAFDKNDPKIVEVCFYLSNLFTKFGEVASERQKLKARLKELQADYGAASQTSPTGRLVGW